MAALTDKEKLELLKAHRARKRKEGPGADMDVGQGLVTDSTEGALNKIADSTGALIDEYDRRSQIDLPENIIAGQKMKPMKFSPVMGTVKSVKKGVKELSDADFAKMYPSGPTGVSGRLGESLPGGGGTLGDVMPENANRFQRQQFFAKQKDNLQGIIDERREDASSPTTLMEMVESARAKKAKTVQDIKNAQDVEAIVKKFPTRQEREIIKAKAQLSRLNDPAGKHGLSEAGVIKVRKILEDQISNARPTGLRGAREDALSQPQSKYKEMAGRRADIYSKLPDQKSLDSLLTEAPHMHPYELHENVPLLKKYINSPNVSEESKKAAKKTLENLYEAVDVDTAPKRLGPK